MSQSTYYKVNFDETTSVKIRMNCKQLSAFGQKIKIKSLHVTLKADGETLYEKINEAISGADLTSNNGSPSNQTCLSYYPDLQDILSLASGIFT